MSNQKFQHFKIGFWQFVDQSVNVVDTQSFWFLFWKDQKASAEKMTIS